MSYMKDKDFSMKGLSSFPKVPQAKGAVVICPGGGYQMLADREAEPVADAYAAGGWQPFVLRYPVKDDTRDEPLRFEPLCSLGRAVREVRAMGYVRVAVCGFSAGGHLAASLGVHWASVDQQFTDEAGASSPAVTCRPDAVVLSYPVISMSQDYHQGSMRHLTGGDPALREYFSLEFQVKKSSPPTFLWHTADDREVPVENSLHFFSALKKAGVAAELHVFPKGEHGLSLATPEVDQPEKNRLSDPHVAQWFHLALGWLEIQTTNGQK